MNGNSLQIKQKLPGRFSHKKTRLPAKNRRLVPSPLMAGLEGLGCGWCSKNTEDEIPWMRHYANDTKWSWCSKTLDGVFNLSDYNRGFMECRRAALAKINTKSNAVHIMNHVITSWWSAKFTPDKKAHRMLHPYMSNRVYDMIHARALAGFDVIRQKRMLRAHHDVILGMMTRLLRRCRTENGLREGLDEIRMYMVKTWHDEMCAGFDMCFHEAIKKTLDDEEKHVWGKKS